jgi:thiol peroxidase
VKAVPDEAEGAWALTDAEEDCVMECDLDIALLDLRGIRTLLYLDCGRTFCRVSRILFYKTRRNTMTTPLAERRGAITFKGSPMTLVGRELKVGDPAPDFQLQAADDMSVVTWETLSASGTRAVLLILVPSIDTSVCALETQKFNQRVAELPSEKITVVTVSADTPFAQKRWAGEEHVDNIRLLSDHKDRAFADSYGVRIKELGLLARAIYLIDQKGVVRYIQTVPEVAAEPDYDAVLDAAKHLVGS